MTTPETPGSLEDRIVDLESHLAHQARVVEELNAVVTAQAKTIDRLVARVESLAGEVEDIGEAIERHPVARPPHY
jgi:SlyX protein